MPLHDTNEYVVINTDPGSWPEDMRWVAVPGTRVRVKSGMDYGSLGTIVGHARSRKADRIFDQNRITAVAQKRPMLSADYEILIDNEGPLVDFDEQEDRPAWFPGQVLPVLEKYTGNKTGSDPVVDSDGDELLADAEDLLETFSVEQVAELLKNTKDKSDIESLIKNLSEYLGK